MRGWLAIFLFLWMTPQVFAMSGYLSVGWGTGGTDLSGITGGQDYQIRAGDGLFASVGMIFPVSPTVPHRFETQIGVGYVFQNSGSDNDKNGVSWRRIPVDIIYFYHNTRDLFRLGYGVTYHVENKIEAKGSNSTASLEAKDSLGWVFAAEKFFVSADGSGGGVGLRYTIINYSSSSFSKDAAGDALFFTLTIM